MNIKLIKRLNEALNTILSEYESLIITLTIAKYKVPDIEIESFIKEIELSNNKQFFKKKKVLKLNNKVKKIIVSRLLHS